MTLGYVFRPVSRDSLTKLYRGTWTISILLKTQHFYCFFRTNYCLLGFHLNFPLISSVVDCKTVRIFAYSSKREQSNERSGRRLKTESETGTELYDFLTDFEKKTDCFAVQFGGKVASKRNGAVFEDGRPANLRFSPTSWSRSHLGLSLPYFSQVDRIIE